MKKIFLSTFLFIAPLFCRAQSECGALQVLPALNAADNLGVVHKNACWDPVAKIASFPTSAGVSTLQTPVNVVGNAGIQGSTNGTFMKFCDNPTQKDCLFVGGFVSGTDTNGIQGQTAAGSYFGQDCTDAGCPFPQTGFVYNVPTGGFYGWQINSAAAMSLGGAGLGLSLSSGFPLLLNSGSGINGPSSHLLVSASVPTISSGFGTSPSVSANNTTLSFRVNVGTGGTASSGVIGFPAATTGWHIQCDDITTNSASVFLTRQTAFTTTTATITNFNTTGAATAWASADNLFCTATAF